jgi:hypothetical protein
MMNIPGFTADASLNRHERRSGAYSVKHMPEGSRGGIEPALPGRPEQAYIDCLIDCRVSRLGNCVQRCSGHSGTGSGTGSSGSSCPPGQVACSNGCAPCCFNGAKGSPVTCPDGFAGCCPTLLPKCTIFPFIGRMCVPF